MTQDCDLLIVGGGPAGLSAAINGSSEGLKICLLDAEAQLGGQARESHRIENYPMPAGYHSGVTGQDLISGFIAQASRFCANLITASRALELKRDQGRVVVTSDDFSEFAAKSVILAPGLSYRRHGAAGLAKFMGRGVYYGMPPSLSGLSGCSIVMVGGANSAGQAVLRLAQIRRVQVKLVVRRPIEETMSQYLVDRILALPDVIEVITGAEVVSVDGKRGWLKEVSYKTDTGLKKIEADCLCLYIGAVPHTAWLRDSVMLDERNFILTGRDLPTLSGSRTSPLPYETSMDGVFAIGDVRHGSTKRIVNATGEGGAGLQMVHAFLREQEARA